ncbi:MAG: DHH family phosphoesterase [Candidatus Caldatribacteriota bacterium]
MKYELISEYTYNPFNPTFFRDLIFKNRNTKLTRNFLAPTEDNLNHWGLLDNIEEGVLLLTEHINRNSNIFLIVDSDVDGYTSSAIFYNFIKEKSPQVNIKWMVHEGKQHGIILDRIPNDTELLVVIDAGSNQYKEHKILAEKGIDILIIDHHEAKEYSEHAVVINNQLSKNYPNKQLSGAGMAYKFCCALTANIGSTIADKYLDLAAVGIIADTMDVRELENRYIIHNGLKNINNPFLKALISKQSYSIGSSGINTVAIMFYIAPLINSLTRVGTMEEKELMFKAFINGDEKVSSTKKGASNETETIAEQAARVCSNAKSRQKRVVDILQQEIEEIIVEENLSSKPIMLITLTEVSNRNIVGLAANQLAHKYKKPVLILVSDEEESYTGSGRNYNLSEIENLKDLLNSTELFEFAEGHQSAFGAKIKEDNIDKFLDYCNKNFEETDFIDLYRVDFEFKSSEITPDIIKQISNLRPLWGKGFDEPFIVVKDIKVFPEDIKFMGQNKTHVKFSSNGIDYVIFNADSNRIKQYQSPLSIDVIGRCDINIWRDRVTYQLIVSDYNIKEEKSSFGF